MTTRVFAVTVALCIFMTVQLCPAQQTAAGVSAAQARGWDEAWSWGNAFAVKTYFEQLYYSHASALLGAEKQLQGGGPADDVVKSLATLPGVKGAFVTRTQGKSAEFPQGIVKFETLNLALFSRLEDRALTSRTPMLNRVVGGKVRFDQAPTVSDTAADLLVRFMISDTSKPPTGAIALILDPQWLIAQIPAAMDSLYRENVQLLFAAASPRNKIWEQSLGIIAGKDTLWWVGRKDVKIANEQVLWPFEDIKIPSYVHTIKKD